jgi:hypothetical protein
MARGKRYGYSDDARFAAVTFLVMALLFVGAIGLLVGVGRIVAEAFHEGLLWAVAVLFIPGGIVLYVVSHWAICWRGTKPAVLGGVLFGLVWTFGMPAVRASGDQARMMQFFKNVEGAHPPSQCPDPGDLDTGYAAYCCTKHGWNLETHSGCSAVYIPTETCGGATVGQVRKTVCGTIGPRLKNPKKDNEIILR